MREKEGPSCGLTKRDLLEAVAAGETLSSIERAWGMKYNTIHNWVKKWGLKGITPDKAREMLEQATAPSSSPSPGVEIDTQKTVDTSAEEIASPIFADWADLMRKKDGKIEQLQSELERLKQEISAFEKERESERAENDRLLKELEDKQKLLESLERKLEDQLARQLVESATTTSDDPVNHPSHYTAGKVECIDAIFAATTGLTGGRAYSTGAAIKYLWRWSRKGGVEDLKKARWYIDRLIAELEVDGDAS